jgi:hypothetical protein
MQRIVNRRERHLATGFLRLLMQNLRRDMAVLVPEKQLRQEASLSRGAEPRRSQSRDRIAASSLNYHVLFRLLRVCRARLMSARVCFGHYSLEFF